MHKVIKLITTPIIKTINITKSSEIQTTKYSNLYIKVAFTLVSLMEWQSFPTKEVHSPDQSHTEKIKTK